MSSCTQCYEDIRGGGEMAYTHVGDGKLVRVRICRKCAGRAFIVLPPIKSKLDPFAPELQLRELVPGACIVAIKKKTEPVSTLPAPPPTKSTIPEWLRNAARDIRQRAAGLKVTDGEYDQGAGEGMRMAVDMLEQSLRFSLDDDVEEQ